MDVIMDLTSGVIKINLQKTKWKISENYDEP